MIVSCGKAAETVDSTRNGRDRAARAGLKQHELSTQVGGSAAGSTRGRLPGCHGGGCWSYMSARRTLHHLLQSRKLNFSRNKRKTYILSQRVLPATPRARALHSGSTSSEQPSNSAAFYGALLDWNVMSARADLPRFSRAHHPLTARAGSSAPAEQMRLGQHRGEDERTRAEASKCPSSSLSRALQHQGVR